MSAPLSIRLAVESCRPRVTSSLCINASSFKRNFSTQPRKHAITKGLADTRVLKSPSKLRTKDATPERLTPSRTKEAATLTRLTSEPVSKGESEKTSSNLVIAQSTEEAPSAEDSDEILAPRNVLAAYHTPIRLRPQYGVPTCDLQLRSYSVRNLEFMADFAMRAAYWLKLPASGPVPLPRIRERWTVPRSNFVHKKSQENFERITMRRLIQIQDGHTDVVQVWLAFLRKHAFYGVGMKANVWEYETLDVGTTMDKQFSKLEKELDAKLANFGWNKQIAESKSVTEMLRKQRAKPVGMPMTEVREASQTRKDAIDTARGI